MTTTAIDKQFRLYAPQSTKSYTQNDDGSLIIEGIASTTNKDLQGDIVLPSAIESMKNQLLSTSKNLHGDHKYGLDSILGVVKEVLDSDDNTLIIKAVIRKTYAPTIKEMLDIGINLGLSIGGNITDYNPRKDGWEIKDINLFEISLTGMPANFDTYGTVIATKNNDSNIVESKCLAGACHLIRKQISDNMVDNNNNNTQEPTNNAGLTQDDVVNLFNEFKIMS